jgi:hypothetical protein
MEMVVFLEVDIRTAVSIRTQELINNLWCRVLHLQAKLFLLKLGVLVVEVRIIQATPPPLPEVRVDFRNLK